MRKCAIRETSSVKRGSEDKVFRTRITGNGGRVRTLMAAGASRSDSTHGNESWEEKEERESREMVERQEREYDQPDLLDRTMAAIERRKMDVGQFRGMVRAGGFARVWLVAEGPAFQIRMAKHPKLTEGDPSYSGNKKGKSRSDQEADYLFLVTTKGRKMLEFRNPREPLLMLYEMGVTEVQVELGSWRPKMKGDSMRRRPDLAEMLMMAHAQVKVMTQGRDETQAGQG
jgi:hypothetical protein